MKKKKACPISRERFARVAKPLAITLEGRTVLAEVKEFSTGSYGWYFGGKTMEVVVDGVTCDVVPVISLILAHSKPDSSGVG